MAKADTGTTSTQKLPFSQPKVTCITTLGEINKNVALTNWKKHDPVLLLSKQNHSANNVQQVKKINKLIEVKSTSINWLMLKEIRFNRLLEWSVQLAFWTKRVDCSTPLLQWLWRFCYHSRFGWVSKSDEKGSNCLSSGKKADLKVIFVWRSNTTQGEI